MLNHVTRRMIKEGFIYLQRKHPEYLTFPSYYLPLDDKNLKDIATVVSGLQELPELPWPDNECIIFAEDHLAATLSSYKLLHLIVHTKKNKDRYNHLPATKDFGTIEPIDFYTVIYNGRQVTVMTNHVMMVRIVKGIKKPSQKEIQESLHRQVSLLQASGIPVNHERFEILSEYWINSQPQDLTNGLWMATKMSHRKRGEPSLQAGLASDILGFLSNIAVPCYYILKSKFERGFGPTGAMKRLTADKPIFSVVSGHRIYKEFVLPTSSNDAQIPHFRRGHIRHHWKQCGINRFLLPTDPIDRIRLVHDRKVPRSYIPPTWVGINKWTKDGINHEIVTNEIPLCQL